MPYFESEGLKMYYEDFGQGEPIIANHGLNEDCGYWRDRGVTAKLAEHYRVICFDMRGHGQTSFTGKPYGYDADTVGADFGRLADYLGIDKFHMLTHATGGMAGVRYAMAQSNRLLSCMLTDTSSATFPRMLANYLSAKKQEYQAIETARQVPVPKLNYEERKANWRQNPGPFMFKMEQHPDSDRLFDLMEDFDKRRLNPEGPRDFRANFFNDPDPRIDGLKQIKCPTLILLGDFDIVFLGPSELMAWFIPDNRFVLMPRVGHMTAFEDPENTAHELLDFLDCVIKTGRANK